MTRDGTAKDHDAGRRRGRGGRSESRPSSEEYDWLAELRHAREDGGRLGPGPGPDEPVDDRASRRAARLSELAPPEGSDPGENGSVFRRSRGGGFPAAGEGQTGRFG